jgi:flagellar basal-body rod modification protein FlgD
MTTATANVNPSQAILAALNGNSATATKSLTQSAQDRFLTLLTAQLKNQDPLNPLDNAQMTSQLAQISTVDGITKLNATLQTLLNNAADSQGMQAALLVGHGVMVPGSTLAMSQGTALGGFELAGNADSVSVTIRNANGIAVRTLDLGAQGAGVNNFQWDGKTDSGAKAADGNYSISVKAVQGGNAVSATNLQVAAVLGVTRTTQGWQIDVGNLGEFALADVRQIL